MRITEIVALAFALTSCASDPIGRDNPNSVRVISADTFDKQNVVEITACVTNGFKRIPQTIWHNHITSQEVIPKGYRVEMRGTLGGTLMLSVDILNEGAAQLYSSTYGQEFTNIVGVEGQKAAAIAEYKKCVR